MTVLGHHTVEEVKQFIAATQSRVDDLQSAFNNAVDVWRSTDASTADAWSQDFSTWKSQWQTAVYKELGIDATVNPIVSMLILGPAVALISTDDVTPDEDGYNAILAANYWPGSLDTAVAGNINGLDRRLKAAIGNFPRKTAPAQDATDFDSLFIQKASGPTAAVDAVISAGNTVSNLTTKHSSTIGLAIAGIAGIMLTAIGLAYTAPMVATHAIGKRIRRHID